MSEQEGNTSMMFAASKATNNIDDEALNLKPWKILVVDDEPEIHRITKFILKDESFEERKFLLLTANSAKECLNILQTESDIAVILLDVVMETKNAGLDAATAIRKQIKNKIVRIILRTGQPGDAPDKYVMVEYDINDYKEKSDLTSNKLFVSIIAALRSYSQLRALNQCQKKLKSIIDAFPDYCKLQEFDAFAKLILDQIDNLLECGNNLLLLRKKDNFSNVISSRGEFTDLTQEELESSKYKPIIDKALREQKTQLDKTVAVFYHSSAILNENLILIKTNNKVAKCDLELLSMYINNSFSAYANSKMNK